MIYDDLNFFILKKLYDCYSKKTRASKEITTWELAKEYSWEDKPNFRNKNSETKYLYPKDELIRSRLKIMEKEGYLIRKKEKNRNHWILVLDNIKFKKLKLIEKFVDVIILKDAYGRYLCFSIDN